MAALTFDEFVETPNGALTFDEFKPELNGVQRIIKKRAGQSAESQAAYDRGEQSLLETRFQQLGKAGAGTISDMVGLGLGEAYKLAKKDPVMNLATKPMEAAVASKPVQKAAQYVGEKYGDFKEINPRAARNIESAVDIASLIPAGKVTKAAAGEVVGPALSSTGDMLKNSGQAAFNAKRTDFLVDLIRPKPTPTVRADQFARSFEKGGLLRQTVTPPDASELAVAETLFKLPVKKSNSLRGNADIIRAANSKEAQALIAKLKANDVVINDDVILNTFSNVRAELAKNPYVVGDGAKAADNVLNSALDIVSKNPRTASGLLESRKQLDRLIESQRGSKMFDPALESPISNAVQLVRQSINQMVADAVPDAQVKASLARQSNMYRALDNITTKGAFEKPTRIGRAADTVNKAVTLKNAALGTAALGGAGLAGLLSPALLPIGVAGLGLYGAQKALRAPGLRTALGKTLSTTGKVLEKAK